jgi:hypothetical protein
MMLIQLAFEAILNVVNLAESVTDQKLTGLARAVA